MANPQEDKMSPFKTFNHWIVEDTTSKDDVLIIELDGHKKIISLISQINSPLSLCGISTIDKSHRRSVAPGPEWM